MSPTTTTRVLRIKTETFTSQNWGVNELARETGIAPITISKLMRHLEAPSREAMERFARRFPDMEVTDLVEFVSVPVAGGLVSTPTQPETAAKPLLDSRVQLSRDIADDQLKASKKGKKKKH